MFERPNNLKTKQEINSAPLSYFSFFSRKAKNVKAQVGKENKSTQIDK